MKKVLLGLVVIAAMGAFSSCKKECKCTTYSDGVETASVTTEHKGNCDELDSYIEFNGSKTGVECK